ncbi:MAG: hypothetical protein WCO33_00880 [bacterium]
MKKLLLTLKKRIKNRRSVSLLELLITLGIMVILLTMISNVFVEVMRINILNKERTFVREESAILLAQMKKDIRNADSLDNCVDIVLNAGVGQSSNDCTFNTGGKKYEWKFEAAASPFDQDGYVANKYLVTRDPITGQDNVFTLIYTSPDGILFDLDPTPGNTSSTNKIFTILSDPLSQDGELTVLIKLVAKSFPGEPLSEPAVKNVIKQTIVSARNFSSN